MADRPGKGRRGERNCIACVHFDHPSIILQLCYDGGPCVKGCMGVVSSQSFAAVLEGRWCQKNKIEENKNADQDERDSGVQDTAGS
jgi:hypothetical protein